MNLEQLLVSTRVAKAGMTVREVFRECSQANTPGLPFCDDNGLITGRVTLKNILKNYCLPEYLVEMARVLGEQISNVQDMESSANQLLNNPVDLYLQEPHLALTSASSVIKALAMMEQSDTGYIFVVDEGRYRGVVTMQSLARMLARHDNISRHT
jgi:predicted transcriptional regulator